MCVVLQVLLFNYEVKLSQGFVLALLRGMLSLEAEKKQSSECQTPGVAFKNEMKSYLGQIQLFLGWILSYLVHFQSYFGQIHSYLVH